MIKQVIVVRTDLQLRKGQLCAQAAHASLKVILDRLDHDEMNKNFELREHEDWCDHYGAVYPWLTGTFTKIVLGCGSEEELLELARQAEKAGLPFAIVEEAGFNTPTALAIGPAASEDINPITGKLRLL